MLKRPSSATKLFPKRSLNRVPLGGSLQSSSLLKRTKAKEKMTSEQKWKKKKESLKEISANLDYDLVEKKKLFVFDYQNTLSVVVMNHYGTGNRLDEYFMRDLEVELKVSLTSLPK